MSINYSLSPFLPCAMVASLECSVEVSKSGLQLQYNLTGELDAIMWPGQSPVSKAPSEVRTWKLWEHSCFECFISSANENAYFEINLSPSGDWNTFHFTNTRENMREASDLVVKDLLFEPISRDQIRLSASLDFIKTSIDSFNLINLCSVIEDSKNGCHYFAVQHPENRPDFHNRDFFVENQI